MAFFCRKMKLYGNIIYLYGNINFLAVDVITQEKCLAWTNFLSSDRLHFLVLVLRHLKKYNSCLLFFCAAA